MRKIAILFAALTISTLAASAFAQPAPNAQAEHEWQTYLSRHPGLAEHPQWLNNPQYMKEHPNMAKWLHDHPRVLADARHQGMWDHQGQWHDSDWWRDHNPNQVHQYHPEWAENHENHPNMRGSNDGDYDEHHHWYDRGWWQEHHPDWVKQHHPNWMQQGNHGAQQGDHD